MALIIVVVVALAVAVVVAVAAEVEPWNSWGLCVHQQVLCRFVVQVVSPE